MIIGIGYLCTVDLFRNNICTALKIATNLFKKKTGDFASKERKRKNVSKVQSNHSTE
jgi:hypothetical protein